VYSRSAEQAVVIIGSTTLNFLVSDRKEIALLKNITKSNLTAVLYIKVLPNNPTSILLSIQAFK